MWILESTAHPEQKAHSILGDHKYVVGRQNCDIVVADPSVSRRQAVLTMAHYETNVAKSFVIPTLTLEDVSKFGTYVNGKAVKTAGGNTVTLKEDDQIKFGGTPASIYRVKYHPFLATTSCLEKGPKKALQRVMCLLGGHLVRDWRPACDLLIMSKINVTLKVICAINNQKHIVTPKYLDDLYEHYMGRRDKPDPMGYLPEVVDQEVPSGVSFHPDKRRQTLLKGLKFYFMSPLQFNKTNLAVSTAGGQPILLEDGTEDDAEAMTQDGTAVVLVTKDVMDTLTPASATFVRTVIATLRRKNLRMITDPEIGTAILTCNMVDYCNPRAALAPNLQAAIASQMLSQMQDGDSTTQSSFPGAGQAVQDFKPEMRSLPVPGTAERLRPLRNIDTEPQPIKIEKISQDNCNKTSDKGQMARNIAPTATAPHPPGLHRPSSESTEITLISDPVLALPMWSKEKQDCFETLNTSTTGSRAKTRDGTGSSKAPVSLSTSRLSGDLFSEPVSDTAAQPAPSSNSGTRPKHCVDNFERESEGLSVFARQRNRKRGSSIHLDDDGSDCEVNISSMKKGVGKHRRFTSLFDDDEEEEDDMQRNSTRNAKSSVPSKRKPLFDDEDEGMSDINARNKGFQNEKTHIQSKSAGGPGRNYETDVMMEKTEQNLSTNDTMKEGRQYTDLHTSSKGNHSHSNLTTTSDATVVKCPRSLLGRQSGDKGQQEAATADNLTSGDGNHLSSSSSSSSSASAVGSRTGWVNVAAQKTRTRSRVADKGRNEETVDSKDDVDIKPDTETENAGSGKLPTIIGGRDLEEHRTSAHKDLEDLFAEEMKRQNERDEEEKQNRDLFDWDTKSRKTSNRRFH
ncbi:nibrin-like [Plakobranchus ocellatus]|uniref:Nibrin-like n=1 Tax=Plakobranchus ocellatus TaxID=259542 RepID=A0AAV4AFF6_9GAST|nr:nibrin-like [Plakobranchus ocellatus]